MNQLKNYVLTLNLFETSPTADQTSEQHTYEQRTNIIATRVFLILLFVIITILTVLTWVTPQVIQVTISNPNQDQIALMPTDRLCLCSRIAIPYGTFVSSNPSFHQVCSSDFVSDAWISALFYGENTTYYLPIDLRSVGFAYFQTLSSFCQLSKALVNQSLSQFGSISFISPNLVSLPTVLHTRTMATIGSFQASAPNTFRSQIKLISAVIMSNQLLNGFGTSLVPMSNFGQFEQASMKIEFWRNSYDQDEYSVDCICTQYEPLNNYGCDRRLGIIEDHLNIYTSNILNWSSPSISFPNFYASCMPVDACLISSLQCLYNPTCVSSMFPYLIRSRNTTKNFTALNSTQPSRFNTTSRVQSLIDHFLVEDWSIENSFDDYFRQCAPKFCHYLITVHHQFVDVLKTVVGLLGGLCAGLSIAVVFIVKSIRKRFWPLSTRPVTKTSVPRSVSVKDRLLHEWMPWLKRTLVKLNLFAVKSNSDQDSEQLIQYQRMATRLYIIFLSSSLICLTIYLSLTTEIFVESVKMPTSTQFSTLYSRYGSSLRCACSNISILFDTFLVIKPHYHQMCSSDLLSSRSRTLFSSLSFQHNTNILDFSMNAGSQFLILASLCSHTQQTIFDAYQLFINQTLVTIEAISEKQFQLQIEEYIKNWKVNMINSFRHTLRLIQDLHHGNHLAAAYSNGLLDWSHSMNTIFVDSSLFYGDCNCLLSISCRSPMRIYRAYERYPVEIFQMPNFYMGCSRLDALLASTLECFYDRSCTTNVTSNTFWLDSTFYWNILNSSLNTPNETIGSVADDLFVDQWFIHTSFDAYFTECAPLLCTYQYNQRRRLISIITDVIGIFGGLTTSFKILFIISLQMVSKMTRWRPSVRAMKIWIQRSIEDDRKLSLRLHVTLVTVIIMALCFAYSITRQTITTEILKPNIETYEYLLLQYSESLQCSCSQVSISYQSFLNLSVLERHQVCSSAFVTKEWFETLRLPYLQSRYSPWEFKASAIGFFQSLASLCELTQAYLSDQLADFARKTVIHSQVISRIQLSIDFESIIKQFRLDTINSFLITVDLARSMTHNNMLISLFQTNWKWTNFLIDHPRDLGTILHTKPIVYNGSCICGLSSHCTQESTTTPGLMVGCYPFESLLKSNLRCLYNVSCFSLIQSTNRLFPPLNLSFPSRYAIDAKVESILNEFMVEQWSSTMNYDNYYATCDPSSCSYSHIGYRSPLNILTSLLGLYGGVVIIGKVIVSLLIYFWRQLISKRRNQRIVVSTT